MDFTILKDAFQSIPYTRLIVFGSYARNEAGKDSDVDVLVIVADQMSFSERGKTTSVVRRNLAKKNIDADIVIHSEDEVDKFKNMPGSVVRNALLEGIAL